MDAQTTVAGRGRRRGARPVARAARARAPRPPGDGPPANELIEENRFLAARDGMQALLIDGASGGRIPPSISSSGSSPPAAPGQSGSAASASWRRSVVSARPTAHRARSRTPTPATCERVTAGLARAYAADLPMEADQDAEPGPAGGLASGRIPRDEGAVELAVVRRRRRRRRSPAGCSTISCVQPRSVAFVDEPLGRGAQRAGRAVTHERMPRGSRASVASNVAQRRVCARAWGVSSVIGPLSVRGRQRARHGGAGAVRSPSRGRQIRVSEAASSARRRARPPRARARTARPSPTARAPSAGPSGRGR